MAVSIWYPTPGYTSIDAFTPTVAYLNQWDIGIQFVGASKNLLRRSLVTYDVFSAPASGRALTVNDDIQEAAIIEDVILIRQPSVFQCQMERISRADWDYLTADWQDYSGTLDWTTEGGDVAGTPVVYDSPTVTGEREVTGLSALVVDAIASRGGKLHLRVKSNNENPGGSSDFIYNCSDGDSSPLRPRLKVTYQSQDAQPIATPDRRGALHLPSAAQARATRAAPPTGPAHPQRPATSELRVRHSQAPPTTKPQRSPPSPSPSPRGRCRVQPCRGAPGGVPPENSSFHF